jgi:hypothetical protein
VDRAFESWMGQRVVMQLALGSMQVSLRGMLLKNRAENLLMRLDHGLEVEISKVCILAIEEDRWSSPSHNSTVLKRFYS